MDWTDKLDFQYENREMRDVFCDTMLDLAEADPRIVYLDADLLLAMGMKRFRDRFPKQTVDCGIQEANMIGVAAGLSAVGMIPFAHSFGTFISRRTFDQTFLSGGFAKSNIRLVGSDPGVTAAINGGTHQSYEDMGILRIIPDITLVEPTDSVMLSSILRQTAHRYGLFYIRLKRKKALHVYNSSSQFEIGKAIQLKDGNDLTIIASGICVEDALLASMSLSSIGIKARVIDMFTWKPIDKEMIIKAAKETGAILTVENHNIINGLGSAVSEILTQNCPAPQSILGVPDRFGEVGPVEYLKNLYGFDSQSIFTAAKQLYELKTRS